MPIPDHLIDHLLSTADSDELLGSGGLLRELSGRLVSRALEAEMDHHLGYAKAQAPPPGQANRRNGTSSKTLLTEHGPVTLAQPRDRQGSFEPQIVPKHQRRLDGFDAHVVALYARGMSCREIEAHLSEIYGTHVSRQLVSAVTDAVLEEAHAWQSRPLEQVYPVVYFDALFVKMRRQEGVRNQAVHVALGVGVDGKKDVLGLWLHEAESSRFWLSALTELKNRGVDDIFYACVDGVAGFAEACRAVYPEVVVQQCVVHLVRQSLRGVPQKDRKAVAARLRAVYAAPTVEAAERALSAFEAEWGERYPAAPAVWRRAWERVIPMFAFVPAVRRLLYTTNPVESVNRRLRRVLKTRGAFVHADAVRKVLFLALGNASKRWTRCVAHWPEAISAFTILFPERMPETLT